MRYPGFGIFWEISHLPQEALGRGREREQKCHLEFVSDF